MTTKKSVTILNEEKRSDHHRIQPFMIYWTNIMMYIFRGLNNHLVEMYFFDKRPFT